MVQRRTLVHTRSKVPAPLSATAANCAAQNARRGKSNLLPIRRCSCASWAWHRCPPPVYEQERLRCNPVWRRSSRPRPPRGFGSEKYDETAAAMIGTVKYGAGLPFNRPRTVAGRHGAFRCPQPRSGKSSSARPTVSKPVHGERGQPGRTRGPSCTNDDTPAKILELMAEVDDEKLDEE